MKPAQKFDRITHDAAVMGGKPCIRGLRVTVGLLVGLVAQGRTKKDILADYPYLEAADVDQALAYAAWRLEEPDNALEETTYLTRSPANALRLLDAVEFLERGRGRVRKLKHV